MCCGFMFWVVSFITDPTLQGLPTLPSHPDTSLSARPHPLCPERKQKSPSGRTGKSPAQSPFPPHPPHNTHLCFCVRGRGCSPSSQDQPCSLLGKLMHQLFLLCHVSATSPTPLLLPLVHTYGAISVIYCCKTNEPT